LKYRRDNLGRLLEPVRTEEGFLLCEAYITRPGVFEYAEEDGRTRRELRPRSEVYHPDSLASFARKPTTLEHPTDEAGVEVRVDPSTARQFVTGAVSERVWVDKDVDMVRTTLTIYDADHIEAIERLGWAEQSCGYDCELLDEPGVDPEFGPYDAVQINIRGNHVATVPAGRAGREVRLRRDAAIQVTHSEDEMTTKATKARRDMDEPKEDSEQEGPRSDMERMDQYMADMSERMDAMMGKLDSMMERMDALMREDQDEPKSDEEEGEGGSELAQELAQDLVEELLMDSEDEPKLDRRDAAKLPVHVRWAKQRAQLEKQAKRLGVKRVDGYTTNRALAAAVVAAGLRQVADPHTPFQAATPAPRQDSQDDLRAAYLAATKRRS
jgi:hypothetical protein